VKKCEACGELMHNRCGSCPKCNEPVAAKPKKSAGGGKPKRLKGFKKIAREKTMRDVRRSLRAQPTGPDVRPLVVASFEAVDAVLDLEICDLQVKATFNTLRHAVALLQA
jgi:hypothetical protein